ncbi:MAG: DNA adenine methylase [Bacteroidales bacterium]|nr:DNA adenine methylase [Bacteroidales bacterium]
MIKQVSYTPLRYPGGKSKLYNLVQAVIAQYGKQVDTYVEPFAGGAGIAMGLLLNHQIDNVIINDINTGVYSFWYSVCNDTENLLRLISDTDINIANFIAQKEIYKNETLPSLELGFATFFLNRTCFSGVLNGGPIGGYNQTGKYLINARYNRKNLLKRIEQIAQFKSNIEIHNVDILEFIKTVENKRERIFTYFDPPYFIKGKALYTNFLNKEDHKKIYNSINEVKTPWLITYDNVEDIANIYKKYPQFEFNLSYTVNSKVNRIGTELMITSDVDKFESINKDIYKKFNLKRKEVHYA